MILRKFNLFYLKDTLRDDKQKCSRSMKIKTNQHLRTTFNQDDVRSMIY